MDRFDIDKLLADCLKKSLIDLIEFLTKKVDTIDTIHRNMGKRDPEEYRLIKYKQTVGELLFFLNTGVKPSALTDNEFQLYRPIIQNLVNMGNLSEDALKYFREQG